MKSYIKHIIPAVAAVVTLGFGLTACTGDLDVTPIDPNLQTEIDPNTLFNKCYANMALAGQSGPDGDCDIDGLDGGTTGFVRQYFNTNELGTDEAICGWGDTGIPEFIYNRWNASHPMVRGYYYRLYFGVTLCNKYLENFSEVDAQKTAEVRYLRALYDYLLMDAFGNVRLLTKVSNDVVLQSTRAEAFTTIEKELLEIEPSLAEAAPKTSSDANYGRVDKAAAWMLLARMYLNAEVYTGTPQWDKAAEYAKKVMDSGYKLYTGAPVNGWTAYEQLFMGNNGENGSSVECILPILQDGKTTASYGTTYFLTAGAYDDAVLINPDGVTTGNNTGGQWGGQRARKSLIDKFFPNNNAPYVYAYQMPAEAGDDRALFDGNGRTVDCPTSADVGTFTAGFAVAKFNNFYTEGSSHDASFPDADFFFFRVAEAYLTYAEATARLNGGNTTAEGTKAINDLRARAHAQQRASGSYTLSDICDEWSREFYFEGLRRQTLIRFDRFGGENNYNWPWKGGAAEGTNFKAYLNIYAIPSTDLTVSEGMVQNPGYSN